RRVLFRSLRARGFTGEVVLIGAEAEAPYDRPPLSKAVLAGAEPERLDPQWFAAAQLRLGVRATALRPTEYATGAAGGGSAAAGAGGAAGGGSAAAGAGGAAGQGTAAGTGGTGGAGGPGRAAGEGGSVRGRGGVVDTTDGVISWDGLVLACGSEP